MFEPVRGDFLQVVTALQTGTSISDAVYQVAERRRNPYFDMLAEALAVREQQGGKLKGVLQGLQSLMHGVIQIQNEVRARQTQPKLEGTIVAVAPFGFLVLLKLVMGQYEGGFYGTLEGQLVLAVAVVFSGLAYSALPAHRQSRVGSRGSRSRAMTSLWLAFLGGLGALLIVTAARRRAPRTLALRVGLEQVQARRPLVDRLFGRLAQDLARRGNRTDVETQLKQAGLWERVGALYPDARTFYAYKLASAAGLGVLGLGFGVLLAGIGGLPPSLSLGVAAGTGSLGFFLPDLDLKGRVARRDDQMIADMASALDRLANFLAAGFPLPYAIHQLAQRPGGVFVAELRNVAAQYNVSGDLTAGIDALLEDNGNLLPLVPFATLVKTATRLGGGVGESLRALAEELRAELTQRITARGYRNTVLMIVPAFFAILATLLVLAAPGALRAFASLSSGGF